MRFDYIINAVNEIIETVGSRNLEDICSYYNILIKRHDLQKKLKAYFYYNPADEVPIIVIDSNIQEIFYRVLMAHELGHYFLHRQTGMVHPFIFQEYELLETEEKNAIHDEEFEANMFASELLIEDEAALEALHSHAFFNAASILNVPPALLDLKLRTFSHKGYTAYSSDYAKGNYLKEDKAAYGSTEYSEYC